MSDSPRIPDYYQSTVDSSGHCQGDCDANGLPLNGRLKSVTLVTNDPNEATSYTTSYAYNLATNTTTVTYPADSNNQVDTATMVYDSMGDLLSSTDPPPLALLLRQEARWIGVGFGTGLLGGNLWLSIGLTPGCRQSLHAKQAMEKAWPPPTLKTPMAFPTFPQLRLRLAK